MNQTIGFNKTYNVYAKRLLNSSEPELVGTYDSYNKISAIFKASNDPSSKGIYCLDSFFAICKPWSFKKKRTKTMNRITEKDLKAIIHRLNVVAGHNPEPYTKQPDGSYKASPFSYHLSCAYGGYALHQFGATGSGVRDVFNSDHTTKRDLYNRIQAYLGGMER